MLLLSADDPDRGSLRLGADELVALIGPSGSGKTEWFRALLGLRNALAMVRLGGRMVGPDVLRERVGWVPDGDGVFLSQTVWGNVGEVPHQRVLDADVVADALDRVALLDRAQEAVATLSTADRRRVALARAFALRREVLLIDSPMDATLWAFTENLVHHAPWIRGVIVGVACADHVVLAADSVALMHDGRILSQRAWADLLNSPRADVQEALGWVRPDR